MKYSPQQNRELKRAVDAFNRKVRYQTAKAIQQGKSPAYLPEKVTVSQLKQQISNKADMQREIKNIRKFGQRGAEQAVKVGKEIRFSADTKPEATVTITQWEKQQIENRTRIINIKRAAQRKKMGELEAYSAGQPLGYKRNEMHTIRLNDLAPKKTSPLDNARNRYELRKAEQSLAKQTRADYYKYKYDQYKQNYIKAIHDEFDGLGQDIINKIEQMTPEEIAEVYYSEQQAEIKVVYDKNWTEETRLNVLRRAWNIPEPIEYFNKETGQVYDL